jgi:hypothetical protein
MIGSDRNGISAWNGADASKMKVVPKGLPESQAELRKVPAASKTWRVVVTLSPITF